MTKENIITNFKRTQYGEIINPAPMAWATTHAPSYFEDLYSEARCMIQQAEKKGKIPREYDNIKTKWKNGRPKEHSGDACRHEIYDISGDARHTLLCCRTAEGNKYGIRTISKTYFIISTWGKGLKIIEASKSKAAKAAKQAKLPGDAIKICLGKKKLRNPATEKRICFKIVAKVNDSYQSVYDDSAWDLGTSRIEKSSMNHGTGFYVFPSVQTAVTVWKKRLAFADKWMTADEYALLECECYGRSYRFDNDKICISRVKPMKEVLTFC